MFVRQIASLVKRSASTAVKSSPASASAAPKSARAKRISPATIMRSSPTASGSMPRRAAPKQETLQSGQQQKQQQQQQRLAAQKRADLRYHAAKYPPSEMTGRPPLTSATRRMHTSARPAAPATAARKAPSLKQATLPRQAAQRAANRQQAQQGVAGMRADLRYHAAKYPPPQMLARPSTLASATRGMHTSSAALRRSRKTMQSAGATVEEADASQQPAEAQEKANKRQPSAALKDKRIVFLGSGKMAEAIMGGMVNCGAVEASQVTACDPNAGRRTYLKDRYHVLTTANNATAAENADILILAVKPQTMGLVFDSIRDKIAQDCLVVSIAAGFTLSQIREGLGVDRIVRAMPNTPALINESITSWIFTHEVSADQRRQAKELLNSFGEEVLLYDERQLDMATALSGSGPAMCQLMFESMIDAGVHMGFPRDTSRKLVLHTVRGAVNLALHSGEHPSMLKNDITSPGGTTAAALYQLERGGMRTVFTDAVWAAYRRSRELGGLDSNVGPGRFQVASNQLELPDELVENLQQATEAMSAVKEEISELKEN